MPKIPTYALARSAERKTSPQTRLASGVARPGAPHDRYQTERARQNLLLPALLQGATPAQSDGPTPVSPEHGRSSPALPPLLTTKLHAPRLRTRLVSRAHLIEKLRRGVQGPLTLLSAPAGFGKTTVLAQWLRESDMPVAWLSLEPEDNDPTRFLLSLIAA